MHPMLGPRVGFLWTIVIGHALPKYSLPRSAFTVDMKNFAEYATHWLWGSQVWDMHCRISLLLLAHGVVPKGRRLGQGRRIH